MKPLDKLDLKILSDENAKFLLSADEYKGFCLISENDRLTLLKDILEKPIDRYTPVNDLYFRFKWSQLIKQLYKDQPITILEVASGDADMIPQALSRSNPGTEYITANMNVKLNESLLQKTKELEIKLTLIDDDASNIKTYIAEKSVQVIAFQHGVNDVLQAILCGQNGVDTIHTDWMECLPGMIMLLQKEIEEDTFEANVKQPFLELLYHLLSVLKEDGLIAISHYMFQLDLNWGYPEQLFENLVPMVRKWVLEWGICREAIIEGYDSQWWLFLKK